MERKKPNIETRPRIKKRDYLDIFESYKYMNSDFINPLLFDGRWDYAQGWIELNFPMGIDVERPIGEENPFPNFYFPESTNR